MRIFNSMAIITSVCFPLLGCGTYTPEIQEFWGHPGDTSLKVKAIANQVKCELSYAINWVVTSDLSRAKQMYDGDPAHRLVEPELIWFPDWVVLVTLSFNIVEKTSINPGVAINKVLPTAVTDFSGGRSVNTPQSFGLSLGLGHSNEATRISKLSIYFRIGDLMDKSIVRDMKKKNIRKLYEYAEQPLSEKSCLQDSPHKGDLFVESDLKLKDWLVASMLVQWTGVSSYKPVPQKIDKGVISHQVKFQIVSSGNINPVWRLVTFTGNSGSSPLFNTSRDRTQDLLITMGPPEKTEKARGTLGRQDTAPPASAALLNSHFASEIGSAVAAAIRAAE